MTSNKIMQEIQAFKVATKNAEDAHATIGMQKSWKPSFEGQGCGT
jgi:hypothetical protein